MQIPATVTAWIPRQSPIFISFDVSFTPRSDGLYNVSVIAPGQAAGTFRVPDSQTARLEWQVPTEQAQQIGNELFDALFTTRIRDLWRETLATAKSGRNGVRLRLWLGETPELASIPWELLYDTAPGSGYFLAMRAGLSIVRFLQLPPPPEALSPLRTVSMRVIGADPPDYPRLGISSTSEAAEIANAIKKRFTLLPIEPATYSEFQKALAEPTDIMHFAGHGEMVTSEGENSETLGALVFAEGKPISAPRIVAALGAPEKVRLVLLNSCHSGDVAHHERQSEAAFTGVAQALIRADVPIVVGMQGALPNSSAPVFASVFYRALAAGRTADAAVKEGRVALQNHHGEGASAWAIPVLYTRAENLQVVRPGLNISRFTLAVLGVLIILIGGLGIWNVGIPQWRRWRIIEATPRIAFGEGQTLMNVKVGDTNTDFQWYPFTLDKYEVRNVFYCECVQAGECDALGSYNVCNADRGEYPVNQITQGDAQQYCEWLGQRLPTEIEWEWAARGANPLGRAYPTGMNKLQFPFANVCEGAPTNACSNQYRLENADQFLRPVTYLEPKTAKSGNDETPEGVVNMTGNVSEWTISSSTSYSSPIYLQKIEWPPVIGMAVYRGGNILDDAQATAKQSDQPTAQATMAFPHIGFRCATGPGLAEIRALNGH